MKEIKFIPGTGNAYSCDKNGNVYSHRIGKKGEVATEPQKQLKLWLDSSNQYFQVTLSFEGKMKNYLVHRLIAMTWIENPNNYSEVDHIDNNPKNNCVKNLQWISRQLNIDKQIIDKGALNGLRTSCKLYKIGEKEPVKHFSSITEACIYASEQFGCSKTGMQRNHQSKEYYLIAENEEKRKLMSQKMKSKWELFSPSGKSLGIFNSKREAGRYIKENIRDISIKLFSDKGKTYGYYVIEKSVETN